MPKLDWLDRLSFSEIEAICEKEKRESDFMFLNVEFPIADYASVQVKQDELLISIYFRMNSQSNAYQNCSHANLHVIFVHAPACLSVFIATINVFM